MDLLFRILARLYDSLIKIHNKPAVKIDVSMTISLFNPLEFFYGQANLAESCKLNSINTNAKNVYLNRFDTLQIYLLDNKI